MKDMGKKVKDMPETAMASKQRNKKVYPSISFSSDTMPEIAEMKMGDTVEMKCKCKVKGLRAGYDNKDEIVCEMNMTECSVEDMGEDGNEAKRLNLSRKDFDELRKDKKGK